MRRSEYEEPDPNAPLVHSGRNPYHGYIYVLLCEGFVKIGQTTGNISSRILSLQCGNPFPILFLGVIESEHIQDLERELHQRFQAYHVRGEWFKIPDWLYQTAQPRFCTPF